MSDEAVQLDAFTTPGTLLKKARQAQGMTEREAADRLNLMPNYVAILERDDYMALRSPPFARGYVKAYGRLLGLNERHLLSVFDQVHPAVPQQQEKRRRTRPLQLQRTGLGVVVSLGVLLLLVTALWWWEEGRGVQSLAAADKGASLHLDDALRFSGGNK